MICCKIFSAEIRLEKHLIKKHEVRTDVNVFKPFNCDLCDKSYTSITNLTLHKATHIGKTVR